MKYPQKNPQMTKRKKRPMYTDEFKRDTVRLVEQGMSFAQVAKDLGVSAHSLRSWRKTLSQDKALEEDERAELMRLRKENHILKQEPPSLPRNRPEPYRVYRREESLSQAAKKGWC